MSLGKDLIYCANRAEELRKALHRKNKICQHDCKEFRLGMLTVLGNLGFLTYDDESIDVTNEAGAWDKELRGKGEAEEVGHWTEYTFTKNGYGEVRYQHKECEACGIELFTSPYKYCSRCGIRMLRKKDTE